MGIWFARVASVWLLAGAWWECAYSVLPFKVDQVWVLSLLLLFSCLFNFICSKHRRRYVVPAALLGTAAAAVVLVAWNKKIFVSALNHIANTYMRYGVPKDQEILLYKETAVSVMQRSVAIAVILLPLVLIFTIVLWYQRGKVIVFLLCAILPLILVGKAGFPKSYACWMLILAAGVYFSISGIKKGREAWIRAFAAASVLLLLMVISVGAGENLNKRKAERDGGYYKVRKAVQENVVDRVTGWVKPEEDKEDEQEKKQEEENQQDETDNNDIQQQQEDAVSERPAVLPWEGADDGSFPGEESYGEFNDLGNVSRFSPNPSVNAVIKRKEKPDSTVYEPLWYGGFYAESMWDRITVNDEMAGEYSMIPEEVTRLIGLCKENPCSTPKEAEAFITRQFEENTVYDYEPGRPPRGIDFAEYFLFDNKKGFCVHFATTATLMYRMYGIPARYAEGYAIPADAFKKQEDGSYAAQVTGEMGHAWCEIYEDGWIIKEHTLPYRGPDREEKGPASDIRKTALESAPVKMLIGMLAVLAVLCVAIIVFFIQAAVRRRKRWISCYKVPREVGIQNLYRNIYDMAVFLGMDKKEPLTTRTVEDMSAYCTEVTKEELLWMKEVIQEILFYNKKLTKEEFKKACHIHDTFIGQAKEKLISFQKLQYRYIYCLG